MMHKRIPGLILVGLVAAMYFPGCSDKGDNPIAITPPVQPGAQISFSQNVRPILQQYGCISCHGGSGGLVVGTVPQLMRGGDHGPAVVTSNADSSNIIKKISTNPPFGDRMPQGGPYLPDNTIQTIKDWINQGAKDN
jgi:hypothetical protein